IQAIGNQEHMSVTEVAAVFGVTKSAASQMVSRLVDKGFLEKRQAPHSNKEYQLRLTPLGWKAYDAHENFHGKDREELIKRLRTVSKSEIIAVTTLLDAMNNVLDRRMDT
ncbi:MAG: MarR family transcriptional regulator, partial [Desulfovibrionaceae bacterium]|nr:MarR family transcriptional regulator [Desulfovibrionaceae bacterium]